MQPVTVQLEIYAQWRLWSGSYADNGKSSPSTINDPLDWRTYSDTTSFPTLKPDFTVFGVPRRSRKQRGWYQVKKRNASSPSSPLVYPSATGADVPPELFDRIIEAIAPNYLQDTSPEERQILAACGQVCRFQWLQTSCSSDICSLVGSKLVVVDREGARDGFNRTSSQKTITVADKRTDHE